jgi:hypothetical protein
LVLTSYYPTNRRRSIASRSIASRSIASRSSEAAKYFEGSMEASIYYSFMLCIHYLCRSSTHVECEITKFERHRKTHLLINLKPTNALMMKLLRSMISTSIELNNAAITYLDSLDKLAEAYLLLSEASANLKQVMHELQGFPTSYITHKKFQYQWQELLSPQNIGTIIKPSNQGSTPFLYLQALSIHDDHAEGAKDDEDDDESNYAACVCCPCSISWVIHYNLALTAHLLGVYCGERGTVYLAEACRLYDTVRARVENEKSPSANFSILHMAVLNNKGCICKVYEMNDLVSDYIDKVQSILLTMKGTRSSQLNHFLLNVMILKNQHLAAAA